MEITSKEAQQPGAASPTPGSPRQIGPYQVTEKIGQGGMGEVYRAHDAKLGRDVALKILPAVLAHDSQSLARLEREARTLASLNHPNIAVIYGLEESDGVRALVMELVEGKTLAESMCGPAGKGLKPLSAEEALPIARQIAEALEYAHERGVIHRDLKPANAKITPEGTVKVLDFGLAKVLSDQDSSAVDPANSPTLSAMATQAGMILGTAAYMAPEQAKGKQVDRRADIWAFGCVLFEMLAGKKAFEGETISDVLASVIKSEPEWAALPKMPSALHRLIRRCLVKDPKQRLRDIGEARIAIEESMLGAAVAEPASGGQIKEARSIPHLRRALPWALGAAAILFAGVAAWLLLRPAPQRDAIRFSVPPPENGVFVNGGVMNISPDGRYMAFIAAPAPDKASVLWLRPLNSLTATPAPETEGAFGPFWSPDSREIGFVANGKLEKIAVSGGAPQTLCEDDGAGGSWNGDGVILFATRNGQLYRVPDTGGAPTLVAAPDTARKEAGFGLPQFLPGGRHFLVQVGTGTDGEGLIGAGSLDSKTVEHLGQAGSNALYAQPGYLFYLDQSTLMARPFSAKALSFTGPPVPVAENVGRLQGYYGFFSVSPAGLLAYEAVSGTSTNQMTWFSRTGQKLGTVGQPDVYATPALSPDGTRLAVAVGAMNKRDVWVNDLKRGTGSRLTFNPADDVNPTWSQDGSRILFSSDRAGRYDIYQKAADGVGGEEPVFQSKDQTKYLDDLSADGRYAVFDSGGSGDGTGLWAAPLFDDRKPFPFVQGAFGAHSAKFSPNGRFVAYSSTETGRLEIYVQTFPQQTGKWQISVSGGAEPMWRRDGKELFFLTSDGKLMAVDVNTASQSFQAGIPKPLFQTNLIPLWVWRNIYVPSPDGQRFLMLTPVSEAKQQPITVVVNWPALLQRSDGK